MLNKTHTWKYFAEQTENASQGLKKERSFWPRGKMLGGSGGINAMLYVRGNRRDYDQWNDLGNPSWGFDDVLPYFKKSEGNRMEHIVSMHKGKYHGTKGPLTVDNYRSIETLKSIVYEAAFELGYIEILDINADEHIGFSTAQGTIENGRRCSPAKAFLNSAKDRPNLKIIKHAHVTEIIIENNQAKGVRFQIGDKKLKAFSKKEVILSAGAINTPQILMLSGIGPKNHLKEMKIPVKKDLPVGKNLQDHAVAPITFTFHKNKSTPQSFSDLAESMYQYLRHKVGKFTALGTVDLLGFVNVNDRTSGFPDIQYHFFGQEMQAIGFVDGLADLGLNDDMIHQLVEANQNAKLLMSYITLLNPKSRGSITLRSNDPFDHPIINANYLDVKEDAETMVKGLKNLKRLLKTKNFKMHGAEELRMKIETCDQIQYDTDDFWECYIRHLVTTIYHPVGTAKMGPDSDPEAVVDSKLKVKGIKGLRVIDASIMPFIVSGNTNAPTIMIGEKGADFIKEDWSLKDSHTEL